jgi:hypothetical protein
MAAYCIHRFHTQQGGNYTKARVLESHSWNFTYHIDYVCALGK